MYSSHTPGPSTGRTTSRPEIAGGFAAVVQFPLRRVPSAEDRMRRPITLFTGQWADLPFETLCQKAKSFGYDGLELACWGDHFEVRKALDSRSGASYLKKKWLTLDKHGLQCFAISAHLVGQAVCDRIDDR